MKSLIEVNIKANLPVFELSCSVIFRVFCVFFLLFLGALVHQLCKILAALVRLRTASSLPQEILVKLWPRKQQRRTLVQRLRIGMMSVVPLNSCEDDRRHLITGSVWIGFLGVLDNAEERVKLHITAVVQLRVLSKRPIFVSRVIDDRIILVAV